MDGIFRCVDATGATLDTAAALTCPAAAATEPCPSTERAANLASCTEQGLLCAYPGACANRIDQCQCSPGAMVNGRFGLRFECTPGCSALDGGVAVADSGGVPDSRAISDAGQRADSGADSDVDSSSDAASDGSIDGDARAE
jgi:hypothetical protein